MSVGSFAGGLLHALGLPVGRGRRVTVAQDLGELAAVAGIVWLVLHVRGHDAVRLCGLALLLLVVLSPPCGPGT